MPSISSAVAARLTVLLIAVSGCTAAPTPTGSIPPIASFWDAVRITGDEVEGYKSIAEMGEAADAVVVGRFTSLGLSREVHGDAPEDVVLYAAAQLEIGHVFAGRIGERSIPFEFLLGGQPAAAEMQALEDALPRGDLIVFLRDKGGREAGLYRAVNSVGLWASSDRATLDTPLAEAPPAESVFAGEVAGIASVAEMAEYVSTQVDAASTE